MHIFVSSWSDFYADVKSGYLHIFVSSWSDWGRHYWLWVSFSHACTYIPIIICKDVLTFWAKATMYAAEAQISLSLCSVLTAPLRLLQNHWILCKGTSDSKTSGLMTFIQHCINVDASTLMRLVYTSMPAGYALDYIFQRLVLTVCVYYYWHNRHLQNAVAWFFRYFWTWWTTACTCKLFVLIERQREKMYLLTCARKDYSDLSVFWHSLIWEFICTKKLCIIGCPERTQWRFWSYSTNAQADVSPGPTC